MKTEVTRILNIVMIQYLEWHCVNVEYRRQDSYKISKPATFHYRPFITVIPRPVKLSLRKGRQAIIFIETKSHVRQDACLRSTRWSLKQIIADGHWKHKELPPLRNHKPNCPWDTLMEYWRINLQT